MKLKRRNQGFTLIEILVALVIAAIIMGAVYELFLSDYKTYTSHNLILDAHQNEKMAIEFMSRELQLIGYDAETSPVTADIITAGCDSILFEEYNTNNNTRVKILYEYRSADKTLVRRFNLWNPSTSAWDPATDEVIVENVNSFDISYYADDNILMSFDPATCEIESDDLPDIRRMDIALEVRTEEKEPIRNEYVTKDLMTSIYIRNLGIDGNLLDTTPPDAPLNVAVSDPNNCGELEVSWSANTEGDLAGYVIYLNLEGRAISDYTHKFAISDSEATSYILQGLDNAPSNDPASLMYYIAVSAFDRSMNMSDYSVEVSGDGSSDSDDTIPNPDKPTPPENLVGEEVAGEGQVKLTWYPSPDMDVIGYRIYRSTVPFDTYPIVEDATKVLVAAESELFATVVLDRSSMEFTDTGLIGCMTYYYAISAINCDYTLVTDDAGDDSSIKYIVSDYRLTYGDGIAGAETDSPTGSDTTPGDITAIDNDPYSVPDLSSKAGWKRVFLSITNPNRSDDPDFSHTALYYNTSGYPVLNPDGTVSDGTLIPDAGGIFTAGGTLPPVIFDSIDLEMPIQPELEIFQTYYFIAVAYDLCGNTSDITESAITLSELCGDDPDYAGAPPVPTGLTAEGCYSYAYLNWDHQGETIVDLAGYHVYRSEGDIFNLATSTELTGGVPQWFDYFMDADIVEGGTYSYGVRATDCYYENIAIDDPNYATAKIENISDPVTLSGIKPGRVRLETGFTHALTGDLTVTAPTFYHNTVTFFIENTSASSLTIKNMDLEWENTYAHLDKVYIGSDDIFINTPKDLVWDSMAGPVSSGVSINTNKTLLDYGSPGNSSDPIPVTLVFTDMLGDIDGLIDMREDTIVISLTYVNDSMPTIINCPLNDFQYIPLGPTVVGVTQDKPGVATPAWAVPGDSGVNPAGEMVVPGGVSVSISANVYDNSNVGIKSVDLYYYVDTLDFYNEVTGPPVFDGSNYTVISMELIAGSLYRTTTPIPNNDDATIWYFILAEDFDGNFDRSPEIESGAYTYYQQEGDVCNNTPNPPTNIAGSYVITGTGDYDVEITWDPPTKNTDGSDIGLDLMGYNVYRNDGTDWVKVNTDVIYDEYYTDAGITDLDTKEYTYYVTTLDFCEPFPNESEPSSIYSECEGASLCSISVDKTEIIAGDTLSVTLKVCERAAGGTLDTGPNEILYIQTCSEAGDSDPIKMIEDGDSGFFYVDEATYGGRNLIQTYLTDDYPASPIMLDLEVNPSDTIIIGGTSVAPYSNAFCEDLLFDCQVIITVVVDPCDNTPESPGNLRITGTSVPARTVTIAWDAPTHNTDMSELTDLAGYYIYRSDNGGDFNLVGTVGLVEIYIDHTPGKPNQNTYEYYITAIDTCEPPNESAPSNMDSN